MSYKPTAGCEIGEVDIFNGEWIETKYTRLRPTKAQVHEEKNELWIRYAAPYSTKDTIITSYHLVTKEFKVYDILTPDLYDFTIRELDLPRPAYNFLLSYVELRFLNYQEKTKEIEKQKKFKEPTNNEIEEALKNVTLDEEVPGHFQCIITQQIMLKPVQLNCSHSFDFSSIENQEKCPLCRTEISTVTFNQSLKEAILAYLIEKKDKQ